MGKTLSWGTFPIPENSQLLFSFFHHSRLQWQRTQADVEYLLR